MVVFYLSVGLYGTLCGCGGCCNCDACTVICVVCMLRECEGSMVTAILVWGQGKCGFGELRM